MAGAATDSPAGCVNRPRIIIAIASAGRREILSKTLPEIAAQTRQPDDVIVCVPHPGDIDPAALAGLSCRTRIMVSVRGSCAQRNAILDEIGGDGVVLFLDDDFLMAPHYLAELDRIFTTRDDVALVTGTVVADGVTGPGISVEDGQRIAAAAHLRASESDGALSPVYNGYGCNMAVRLDAIAASRIRFDENLPLYGWLEDVDFSRHLARYGRLVRCPRMLGVHLGVKAGRTPGVRFGYSQVANPIYLMRKRTMSFRHGATQLARNLLANVMRVWSPEPWIDRRGRLKGNIIAVVDLLTGRLAPRRVETLE
jgi:GT2 family glycosyltransferase